MDRGRRRIIKVVVIDLTATPQVSIIIDILFGCSQQPLLARRGVKALWLRPAKLG